MSSDLSWAGHVAALLRHPVLLVEAIRAAFAMRARGTARPGADYLRWRATTAYGEVRAMPSEDLLDFLRWRRGMRALRGAVS